MRIEAQIQLIRPNRVTCIALKAKIKYDDKKMCSKSFSNRPHRITVFCNRCGENKWPTTDTTLA